MLDIMLDRIRQFYITIFPYALIPPFLLLSILLVGLCAVVVRVFYFIFHFFFLHLLLVHLYMHFVVSFSFDKTRKPPRCSFVIYLFCLGTRMLEDIFSNCWIFSFQRGFFFCCLVSQSVGLCVRALCPCPCPSVLVCARAELRCPGCANASARVCPFRNVCSLMVGSFWDYLRYADMRFHQW